jgi:hypothetical protein
VGANWPGSMSRAGQGLNIVVMIIRLLYIYAIGLNSFLKSILCILEIKLFFIVFMILQSYMTHYWERKKWAKNH